MKKIVIVSIHLKPSPQAVPLGAGMLAASIKASVKLDGRVVPRLLNFYLYDSAPRVAEAILLCGPDFVGFSMALWNKTLVMDTAAELKRRNPNLVLIAGGPEVIAGAAGIVGERRFDFALPGEGEEALPALLAGILDGRITAVNGLSPAPAPAYVSSLESLPSPFLDGTIDPSSYDGVLWELSRGCPFGCEFCYESRGKKGVRTFPLERLKRELIIFQKAGVSQVYVLDSTFNVNRKRAKDILNLIRKTAPSIHFTFEARSEYLDKELAALFARISCSVQIGLQSAHPEVLAAVGRGIDRNDFYEKVLLLHEAGVVYGFDLIYGLPGDTLSGFLETLDFALDMRPNHLDIFPLSVLPGTRIAEKAVSLNLIYLTGPPYTVLSTPAMNAHEMQKAANIARACERFYNDGGAVAWLCIIAEGLGVRPSELMVDFASVKGLSSQNVSTFIAGRFDKAGKREQGLLAADIIAFFKEPEEPESSAPEHSYTFDPEVLGEYLESGIDQIEELLLLVPKVHS